MTLIELGSAAAVQDFLRQQSNAVVTFSAHWCGPCKASKPALQQLADKYHAIGSVKFGIVYENDLGDAIHSYSVRAFPTYVLFSSGSEVKRVEGANLGSVEDMVKNLSALPLTGGETLGGGGGGQAPLSPAAARAARLSKLAANTTTTSTSTTARMEVDEETKVTKEPASGEVDMKATDNDGDTEMKDAEDAEAPHEDPAAKLNADLIQTLTESMGFSLIRAQKGLLYGNGGTVEGAIEWLTEHQDDVDIDESIALVKAQSYKCNDCGKILSNMANLELHANKTGHSDFEESLERVQPMTDEEKAAKIAEIKNLLKAKRAEREEADKVDETEREKQRRMMGKEMAKTKEQLDAEQRKREAYLRKKEKDEFNKERHRLREELARDRAERAGHKGKLSSRLGVEGYKPDGIQYDVPADGEHANEAEHKPKKPKADAAKIDEYIAKVSGYRAGGDGGKCLKILKAYVGNVVDNLTEEKYKSINMENKAYKTKVKPFIGAKSILLACGFVQNESGDTLTLSDDADPIVLAETKKKLEAAIVTFG